MKEESLVESVVEEQTIEEADIAPVSDVLGEVAVTEQEKTVMVTAMIAGLDWAPLENEKLEAHAEEIIHGIMERIPGLSVRTSKNQHQALSFREGRGRVVCKIWFAKKLVCVETPILEGRSYKVGQSRYLDEKIGLSKKDRSAIVKEIRKYIADRGWTS